MGAPPSLCVAGRTNFNTPSSDFFAESPFAEELYGMIIS